MKTVSFSQLTTCQRCKFKWGMKYLCHYQRRDPGAALDLGKLMHQALALYYRQYGAGKLSLPATAQGAFWNSVIAGQEEPTALADEEYARTLFAAYLERNEEVDLTSMEVVDVEFGFQVPILTPQGTRSNYNLLGYVDLITRDDEGKLWIWDHKTGKSFPDRPSLTLDSQLSTYAWGLRQLGAPIGGVILNLLKTTKVPQFSRLFLRKSEVEIARWSNAIYAACRDLPPPKTDWRTLSRNPNVNCAWDCEYIDLCRLHLEGEDDAFSDLAAIEYNGGGSGRPNRKPNTKLPSHWR